MPSLGESSTCRRSIRRGANLLKSGEDAAFEGETLAGLMGRLGVGEELLWEPARLEPVDPWLGHAPFGFWLLRAVRPRVVVEWSGAGCVSLFSLCQGIEADRLGARVTGLGGWTAAGRKLYRVSDVERWSEAFLGQYGGFGALPRRGVADGRGMFAEGSIDVLVIRAWPEDGRAELERWMPALSARAVVVVQPDSGLAEAVAGKRFGFDHAGGVTVIGVGEAQSEGMETLFGLGAAEAGLARRLFAVRGAACEARGELAAERGRGRALRTGFEAQVQGLRRRQRTELETASREVSTWLERALHRYEQWRLRREEELRGEVEALKGALARTQVERDGAREAVRSVMASTSWRVTRPLRLAASLGRRGEGEAVEAPAAAGGGEQAVAEVDLPPVVPALRDDRVVLPDLFGLRGHVAASRIAVVLHVGEPEFVEVALGWLEGIGAAFDVFVTLVEDRSEHLAPMLVERLPGAPILVFPDRGRDVLPFLLLARSGALFGYELVCKVVAGEVAPSILGERVAGILAGFRGDPDLGMVLAEEAARPVAASWVAGAAHWGRVLPRMGIGGETPEGALGGGVFWVRPFVLRDVVGVGIEASWFEASWFEPSWFEAGAQRALADVVEGAIGLACRSAGLRVEVAGTVLAAESAEGAAEGAIPGVVAFYLPQFHPIAENDAWWGAGFTEWRNVTQAGPSFPGHRQPRLPGELGFTDLRVAETRAAQAELAAAYGVSAFCYYYYWFGEGRRLLQRPLEEVLSSGEPAFPFMICWANEPWSRRWDGGRDDVLMAQDYAEGWEEDFAAEILPLLQDRRYVRLEGRPVILIYRIMHLPSPAESMARLRSRLEALGVGTVHLGAGWFSLPGDSALPPEPSGVGCDSYFEFPPHRLPAVLEADPPVSLEGPMFDYARTVDRAIAGLAERDDPSLHHGVMMGWDNTARRGLAAHVYQGATPCQFRRWLRAVVRHEQKREAGGRFVFVNAWNEWAEGTCLEPDRDFGRGWLEAVRSALGRG